MSDYCCDGFRILYDYDVITYEPDEEYHLNWLEEVYHGCGEFEREYKDVIIKYCPCCGKVIKDN